MPDYNIYIHDLSSGGENANPTKAWVPGEANQTKAWQSKSAQAATGGENAGGWTPAIAAMKGVTQAAKAHPVISAAIVTFAIASKIVDSIEPFVTTETGDYRFNTAWNNIKSTLGIVINPFGTAYNGMREHQQIDLFSKKQEQSRMLIGESLTNDTKRRV